MMVSGFLFGGFRVCGYRLPVDSRNGDFGVWALALASGLGLGIGWGFSAMFGVGDSRLLFYRVTQLPLMFLFQ